MKYVKRRDFLDQAMDQDRFMKLFIGLEQPLVEIYIIAAKYVFIDIYYTVVKTSEANYG